MLQPFLFTSDAFLSVISESFRLSVGFVWYRDSDVPPANTVIMRTIYPTNRDVAGSANESWIKKQDTLFVLLQ